MCDSCILLICISTKKISKAIIVVLYCSAFGFKHSHHDMYPKIKEATLSKYDNNNIILI